MISKWLLVQLIGISVTKNITLYVWDKSLLILQQLFVNVQRFITSFVKLLLLEKR